MTDAQEANDSPQVEPELYFERLGRSQFQIQVRVDGDLVLLQNVNPGSNVSLNRFIDEFTEKWPVADKEQFRLRLIREMSSDPTKTEDESETDPLAEMPSEVVAEAEQLLEDPDLMQQVVHAAHAQGLVGEEVLISTICLCAVSRLLADPVSAIIQGPSSSGKSFVLGRVADLIPPEEKLVIGTFSSKAFYYMPPGSFEHKLVIAGEQSRIDTEESEEIKRHVRELQSEKKISRAVAVSSESGLPTTIHVEQSGPISFIDTTTRVNLFEEDTNRGLLLHTDESPEQTRRIVAAVTARGAGLVDGNLGAHLQLVHHALQRLLRPYVVVVPFIRLLDDHFPHESLDARRAAQQFTSLIQASALLHQRQRELDERGRLVATAEDYAIALSLLEGWLQETLTVGVTAATRSFLQWLRRRIGTRSFTIQDCVNLGKSRGQARHHLEKLLGAGLVRQTSLGRSHAAATYQLTASTAESEQAEPQLNLPTISQVFAFSTGGASPESSQPEEG